MPERDVQTLRAWDRAHLWHPFTPQTDWLAADPLVIERGEGVYLFDTDGRRYLDGVSLTLVQRPRPPTPPHRRGDPPPA